MCVCTPEKRQPICPSCPPEERARWAKAYAAGDVIRSETAVFLSLRDRLRVLFGAHLLVVTVVRTENPVGRTSTESRAEVGEPRRPGPNRRLEGTPRT